MSAVTVSPVFRRANRDVSDDQNIDQAEELSVTKNSMNVRKLRAKYLMSFWKSCLIGAYRHATWPWRSSVLAQLKRQSKVPISILFYHRVANDHPNPWTISEGDFEAQIDWLSNNFNLISLSEAQNRIKNGNSEPSVVITFDDGYAENSSFALPLLIERSIPFTYFVTTYHTTHNRPFPHDVERGVQLAPNSIESLRALVNAGVDIGAHTRNHVDLGIELSDETIFDEVIAATRELESMIDYSIQYFAFPYGQKCNLDPRVFQLLSDHGFSGVCSAYGGFNDVGNDCFHLQRIHADPNLERIKNWLTLDPRIFKTTKYDWQSELKNLPTKKPVDVSNELVNSNAESGVE